MALALLFLLAAIYLDIRLFKVLDSGLYRSVFKISQTWMLWGFVLFLAVAAVFSDNYAQDAPFFLLIAIIPFYILRRGRLMLASGLSLSWNSHKKSYRLISGALGVVIVWGFGVLSFGVCLSAAADLYPSVISPLGKMVLSAGFSSLFIVYLIYKASGAISGEGFMANMALRRGGRPWVRVAVFPALIGLFFACFSSYLMTMRGAQPQTPLNDVLDTTQSPGLILAFLFLAIAIAPLIEEIIFRGYFFYVIKEWLGGKWAIYIIASTFAALHVGQYWGDWLAIAMVTLLGFTLTTLRAWTGTTIAGAVTHYIYNAGVTVIPIVMIAITNPAYFKYKTYFPYHDAQTKEALLKESIVKQPDLADAYNDLAWLYAEEGKDLDTALALAEKALYFSPGQPAYLDTKAEVLEKMGRLQESQRIRARLKK